MATLFILLISIDEMITIPLEYWMKRMPDERAMIFESRFLESLWGLLVVLLGILLALPIPFTNYLFGALMLAFALALLERDGALMLACWGAGILAIAVFGVASGALAAATAHWVGLLL